MLHELRLTQTAAPTETPVTLVEVKEHCHVDFPDDDNLLTGLLNAAVSHLDYQYGILGQAMVTQRWAYSVPGVDVGDVEGHIHLPVVPAASLVTMTYYDTDNAQQSLTVGDYELVADGWTAYVKPNENISWPATYSRSDAITITYDAGFGAASDVPDALKRAILFLIKYWYDHETEDMPPAFDALIAPFRRVLV